jgi:hypothetical protein
VQDQIRGAFAAFRERKNAAVNGGDHVVHEAGVWSLGRDRGVAAVNGDVVVELSG